MARISVGDVDVYPGGGTSPASVTGAPPQWSDDSDSTYATTTAHLTLGSQYVGGDLVSEGVATTTDLLLHARFLLDAANTGVADTIHVHWFIGETDAGATSISVSTLGVIEDQEVFVSADDFDGDTPLTDFIVAVNAGTASVRVLCGSPFSLSATNSATIYELWLGYTPDTATVVRQFPRDDALGWGGAPRNYPPPKANRVIGGYQ